MTSRLLIALGGTLIVSAGCAKPVTAPAAQAAPRLVVQIVVDQFHAGYAERYGSQWNQGLRRLFDEGAYFHEAAYPYAGTVTCAGHASISTGALPAVHGMVLNTWYDRAIAARRPCTIDETVTPVGFTKAITAKHSGRWMEVETFAERLAASQPAGAARVAAFSLKARSAIGLAGKRGDAVVWFEPAGTFATSSAYSAPEWLHAYLKANPVERAVDAVWTRARPAEAYRGSDEGIGERPPAGWTAAFPHALSNGTANLPFYDRWQRSPWSDAYLADLAIAAVDRMRLGRGAGVDYLGVSFSALDLVGHKFGPDSHEVQDVLIGVDAAIGRLLGHLDATVGAHNYVVAFSSDHGVGPVPEAVDADAGRLPSVEIKKLVEAALDATWGEAVQVVDVIGTDVYLSDAARARLAADSAGIAAVRAALHASRAVAAVMTASEVERGRESADPMRRARGLSYYRGRSGDLLVVLRENFTSSTDAASHGTEHAYDRRVPVILFGAPFTPGRFGGAASPLDLAPTLARITGVTLDRAYGRSLDAAVK